VAVKASIPLDLSGPTGAMWRLVNEIDPGQRVIRMWLDLESRRGTSATDAATALGEVLATMTVAFAEQMGDFAGAINGDKGVIAEYRRSLQEKLDRRGLAAKITTQ
jgi:hypothetical protein